MNAFPNPQTAPSGRLLAWPCAIVLGYLVLRTATAYQSAAVAATLENPYSKSPTHCRYETYRVLLCRGLKGNLQALCPKMKEWR